jgi:peptidoglycan/xylan/chitin deacetylase (PgdA/CDA1 family)
MYIMAITRTAAGWLLTGIAIGLATTVSAIEPIQKQGGLVLQFDDGSPTWLGSIAPELKQVNGKASGFVNNTNIGPHRRLTLADLLKLQNEYGWEIGTHTYHHYHTPQKIRSLGLNTWVAEEVENSINELRAVGLNVQTLVFPFNESQPAAEAEVLARVQTFRRQTPLAITQGLSRDKTFPSSSIDISNYVPLRQLKQWVDLAHEENKIMFVFSHYVLPDSEFITGKVVAIKGATLITDQTLAIKPSEQISLVPDTNRLLRDRIHITAINGNAISTDAPDLIKKTEPGATFMIGQGYSIPQSYFHEFITYAAPRLTFYTVSDIVKGAHQPVKPMTPPAPRTP